jgi:fructose-1-phosphate kinase PfkB-like protein
MLLTLGEKGFLYVSSDGSEYIFKSKPRDLKFPAGMGDNLLSAFLFYKGSKGLSVEEASVLAERYAVGYGMTGASGKFE